MRTMIVLFVAILGACWADFPASRFSQDQRHPEQRDASPPGPELGPDQRVDRPSLEGAPREQTILDLPTADVPRDRDPSDQPSIDLPRGDLPKADQLKHDLKRDLKQDLKVDQLKPDVGITCIPGAFLTCANASKDLHKCNPTGNGITVVVCGATNKCDLFLKRCTQCDPVAPPFCQGSNLLSCSSDGLFVATPCPLGCSDGKCCTDGDKDGVTTCATAPDCNDANGDVFPGQQKFFAVPIPGSPSTSYDYNCSKLPEQEFPNPVQCVLNGGTCTGEGWALLAPLCGQTGNWVTCVKATGPGCNTVPATPPTKTQRCH